MSRRLGPASRPRVLVRLAALAPLALPAVAVAAEEAAAGQGPEKSVMSGSLVQFGMAVVVFVTALFVLHRFVWPKILGGLEEREQKIRGEIAAAEEARKNADRALKDYEASLAEARAEANAMIERTKAEQARLAADLRSKAEAELNELRDDARRSIEAAKRAALADVYQETAALATAVAEKILERELNEQDQSRLVEETLAEITQEYAGQPG